MCKRYKNWDEVNLRITFLTETNARSTLLGLIRRCTSFSFAVAWAGRNYLVDEILRAKSKLSQAVIGTHMHQTDPDVLRSFMPLLAARCMPPSGRLFHPKVYLFKTEKSICAVIGSHNLTRNAFEALNVEFSVLIESESSAAKLHELEKFIQKSWKDAIPIDKDDFIFSYEVQHQFKRQQREALDRFTWLHQNTDTDIPPISLSWNDFFSKVEAERGHHKLGDRLAVLEGAAQLFDQNVSLAAMSKPERKAIAGTYGEVEPKLNDLEWGYFGAMGGFGQFTTRINNDCQKISDALDIIPAEGDVSEEMYKKFIEAYENAYAGAPRTGGLATASRLLAMRRPDVFVAMTKANKDGLCKAFGCAPTTTNLSNYWGRIIMPMQSSLWWNASRPRNALQARVWDKRAAFLDAIYYDPRKREGH